MPSSKVLQQDLRVLKKEIRALAKVMEERDKLYKERSDAAKEAVNTALAGQTKYTSDALIAVKESTASAFKASEKAIEKAEMAQLAYNERSNEFRSALDDAQKNLMSRLEANAKFESIEERVEMNRTETMKIRETLSESRGEKDQRNQGADTNKWVIATIIGLLFGLTGIGFAVVDIVMKMTGK